MNNRPARIAALALAGLAAACTTTAPPTQVTRFHLNQPIARGQITVRPFNPNAQGGLELQSYITAVANELTRQGFTVDPKLTTAEQIATVDVQRNVRPSAIPPRSPVSIGVGGGSYGGGLGIAIGTSFGLGGKKSNDITVTTLAVQIKRASDETVVWEGRAVSKANVDASAGDEIGRIAAALFKDFPGASGRTVEVK